MNKGGHDKDRELSDEQPNFFKILLVTLVGIVILGGLTYAGYRYSQRKKKEVTLPSGATYLGPTPKGKSQPTQPELFTVNPDTPWLVHTGKIYPYSFSYPETLSLVVYINDLSDTVSINWGNIPPQRNVLLNMEKVSRLDPKYVTLPKEQYVRNWWKSFSGLKGVKTVTYFTNAQGLKGYRARYFDYTDKATVDNVFFEVPNNSDLIIHFANGVLEESVYDRIIHSVSWGIPTPTIAVVTTKPSQ